MEFLGYTRDAGFADAEAMSGSLSPKFYPGWKNLPDGTKRSTTFIELYFDNGLTRLIDEVVDKPISAEKDWKRRFPVQWKLYEEGRGDEVVGIPIEDLFRRNPERAEYYKRLQVLTVEQLASTSDGNITGLGMGAMADRELAKEYLKLRKEGAVYEALEKEKGLLEAKIKEGQEQMAAQNAKIEELMSLVATLAKAKESEGVKKDVPKRS